MSILASLSQKLNPSVKFIKAKIEYSEKLPETIDFLLGEDRIPLVFLTFKWHLANRSYITPRLKKKTFLLLLLDAEDDVALRELNALLFNHEMRLLIAFNFQDAGKILETLHLLGATRAADICRGLGGSDDFDANIREVLTTIRGVNTTDVANLMRNFRSLKAIANASIDDLIKIPNIADKKALAIYRAFNDPLVP